MPIVCPTSAAPRPSPAGPIGIAAAAARCGSRPVGPQSPLYQAFIEAGAQAGHEHVADHNAFRQEGVHVTQRNVHDGIRWSTSQAYLHAAPPRPNLDVATSARVTGSRFRAAGPFRSKSASASASTTVEVGKEIILAAGAINSPQILLLSGVGDADDLRRLSLPVVAHLPGVGRGLKDHVAAPVQYRATKDVSVASKLTRVSAATRSRWNGC